MLTKDNKVISSLAFLIYLKKKITKKNLNKKKKSLYVVVEKNIREKNGYYIILK